MKSLEIHRIESNSIRTKKKILFNFRLFFFSSSSFSVSSAEPTYQYEATEREIYITRTNASNSLNHKGFSAT